jgi:hypothetical protein
VLPFHFANPVTGNAPPAVTGATRYWKGNWSAEEFGQSGVRPAAEWQSHMRNPGGTPGVKMIES